MSDDLISREALKEKLQARYDNGEEDFDKGYNIGLEAAIDLIDNAPAVEARPKGDWKWKPIKQGDNTHIWVCSECGKQNKHGITIEKFCWNCGADMRGD